MRDLGVSLVEEFNVQNLINKMNLRRKTIVKSLSPKKRLNASAAIRGIYFDTSPSPT